MRIVRKFKLYADSEDYPDSSIDNVIINSGGKTSSTGVRSLNPSASLANSIKTVQANEQLRTLNQMTENASRIKSAQLRKATAEQRMSQYNRRLEIRKDEASARITVQNKKAEVSEKKRAAEALDSFKLPTTVNTPISRNNQTRINK